MGVLEVCLSVPVSVRGKLRQQCDVDKERRNELISWWLQYSPYALDSWKWLSGKLLWLGEESALVAAKRYIHQTPGMSVVNYRHTTHTQCQCCVIMVKGHHKPSPRTVQACTIKSRDYAPLPPPPPPLCMLGLGKSGEEAYMRDPNISL